MTVDPENSCKKGFANVPGIENGAPLIDGPRALIKTVLSSVPSMVNPPIITLSPGKYRSSCGDIGQSVWRHRKGGIRLDEAEAAVVIEAGRAHIDGGIFQSRINLERRTARPGL